MFSSFTGIAYKEHSLGILSMIINPIGCRWPPGEKAMGYLTTCQGNVPPFMLCPRAILCCVWLCLHCSNWPLGCFRALEASPSGMPRIVVKRNSYAGRPGSRDGSVAKGAGARLSSEGAIKGLRRRSSRPSRVSDDSALGLMSQLPVSSHGNALRGSKSFAEEQVMFLLLSFQRLCICSMH